MAETVPSRPVVVIPARFSASASALRFRAEATARALLDAVFDAGGEPLAMHPHAPGAAVNDAEVRARLAVADALLLPGGGDLHPCWSGQAGHASLYDVDLEQDAFDLCVARAALEMRLPVLAVCRGVQVVNVLRGGNVVQDMTTVGGSHRNRTHEVRTKATPALQPSSDGVLSISCYHHQCIGRLGDGLRPVAIAQDGVIEAVDMPKYEGWFLGTQWHPEDTAASDPAQARIFTSLIRATAPGS